ncbi:MAG: aldolase/citrate lyase family protein [Caldilineaceae bacterium]
MTYCAAAEDLGIDVQLRIPHTRDAHKVGRYLDLGPSAVLVPEVMGDLEVDDAIAYAYYGPIDGAVGVAARRGLRSVAKGMDRLSYAKWWNDYVILGIQVESVEAVTNIGRLAKPGVSVVTFGPNDLSFSLEAHPEYPLRTVDDCMRNVRNSKARIFGWQWARGTSRKIVTNCWKSGSRCFRMMRRRCNF